MRCETEIGVRQEARDGKAKEKRRERNASKPVVDHVHSRTQRHAFLPLTLALGSISRLVSPFGRMLDFMVPAPPAPAAPAKFMLVALFEILPAESLAAPIPIPFILWLCESVDDLVPCTKLDLRAALRGELLSRAAV
ncbi:unnamed protein product [marine sediment metagenome]|uniref:Uncharacterized protein n=1 Tax=marine sediment metagenome TaxID=412755 RepID=X1VND2_9ZZZZ